MKIIDNMYYTDTHVYFWRNKTPFSNFYRRPFRYKGCNLQFSEQGFMLEKALLFDPPKVDAIARATQPNKAKALGRAVQNYDDAVWSSVRYDKMVEVLRAKFKEPFMRDILLRTGDRISPMSENTFSTLSTPLALSLSGMTQKRNNIGGATCI